MQRAITYTLLLLITGASFSQTTCDSLVMLKKNVYGFRPSELTDTLKSMKNKELDVFWNTAKRNPKETAPCLQSLIENESTDTYFCFDASSLLARLDTTSTYLPTVAKGLKKCELKELQLGPYLQLCHYLQSRKQDVGELAVRLISIPNAEVFLPDHFITLSGMDAGIFLFNNMPSKSAEDLLINTVLHGNATAKHNAAVILNLHSTDAGDRLLDSLIGKKELEDRTIEFIAKDRKCLIVKPKGSASRSEILEALKDLPYNFEKEFFGFAGNEKLLGSACKQLTIEDEENIRSARQRVTPGLSDEALHEYVALTAILKTVRNKEKQKR